ncbi:MAG: 16S rRNA (guanine(527)-N(7))-methyltransferase RsmG [Anaerolineaceae bacterium]|nr:16S rRNA (guanine(527)-N(7))-methyltransferase RsmG [Anaerolineaceae bacterium]
MEELRNSAKKLFDISLTDQQLQTFQIYENELLHWNERHNLTAIRDIPGIRTKHFLDSLSCVLIFRNQPLHSLIDVGTGAGFPGIPLKILFPKMKLTLVESIGKKVNFCNHIVEQLKLTQVKVIQERAEELGVSKIHREQYDWAVARAVANLPVLVEYLLPLVKLGGHVLSQKGETGPAETQTAEKAIKILGGELQSLKKIILPGVVDERYLITIKKVATTPPQFPRRTGIPSKKPLIS